jgi:hypothetical protein
VCKDRPCNDLPAGACGGRDSFPREPRRRPAPGGIPAAVFALALFVAAVGGVACLVLAGCLPAPAPEPAPPAPAPPACAGDPACGAGDAVLALANDFRRAGGLAPLTGSSQLSAAADSYCRRMAAAGTLSHDLGGPFADRVRAWNLPADAAGENIAAGQPTPEQAVNAWMGSAGHRANLLGHYDLSGAAGLQDSRGRWWWCQDFAASTHRMAAPARPKLTAPPGIEGD